MAANAEQLKQLLTETLAYQAEIRTNAEARLKQAQREPSHLLEILKLVASSDMSPDAVRQAAAVHFKNTIKKGWDVNRDDGNDGIVISATDRHTIKSHLVQLMCQVPPLIQALLSESISLIAEVDYPDQWDNLLPELVQQFDSTDVSTVIGVLKTAHSIFKRFRYVLRSDELFRVIKYTLHHVQAPLLTIFRSNGHVLQLHANDAATLTPIMEVLRLVCFIYYSLIYQDLPEYFEDHMTEWMTDFAIYMQYKNPVLVDTDEEENPNPIDNLQVSIIQILSFMGSNDEEAFLPFLPQFTTLVWDLLTHVTPHPKHDALATKSIKFLSTLVQKQMHKQLFQDEATLRQIVGNIVIANLTFRQSDEERFEDDPREYIVTEVEGSDSESRRRCSQDLLRAMCRLFETETVTICSEHIGSLLAEYSANPNRNWAAKDAAIHLLMGIAVKRESSLGVAEVTQGVNVMEFFQTQILPELQDATHTNRPVLKASSLKFVSVFRKQFAGADLVQLMPLLIAHLSSPVIVVHTFAAFAIERILFTKDDVPSGPSAPKIASAELQPFVESLFTSLFAIVENTANNENDYVMKCVMRALIRVGENIIPVTQVVITKLTVALGHVARNPRNPQFNHYLFESVAVLVRTVCSRDASQTSMMEPLLFEPFTVILNMDIAEFTPYVFQILAQLLEYSPPEAGISASYMVLFSPLLTPALWEKKGNVPALIRLLQAYIGQDATAFVPQISQILGVFQKLLATKSTETSAFELLSCVISHFPHETMDPLVATLFGLLFTRLQTGKTPRYTQLVTIFFALFIGKYGAQEFFDRTQAIQPGMGAMVLLHVWAPRLLNDPPAQRMEAKIQVVGLTKLLCECPSMLTDVNGQKAWAHTLAGLVTLLTSSAFKTDTAVTTSVDDEPEMEMVYDSQFSRLVQASKVVEDPFPEVGDPRSFFVVSLHGTLSTQRGLLHPLLQEGLGSDPKLASGLEYMFQQAGLQLG